MPVTIWRLKDLTGVVTRCTIVPEENESCELRLEQGDQQGQQGNIKQNTTNQGYQQDR